MCDMLTIYEKELAEVEEKIDYYERKKDRIETEIWRLEHPINE